MTKAKIILSAEAGRCPYWDTESNRPTHTCNGCAEPDNPLNAMIDGVRYCLLDIDITGEICRKNVPDTNVGNVEYIRKRDAVDAVRHAWAKGIEPSQYIESIEPSDVVQPVKCGNCEAYIDLRHWCKCHNTRMFENDFCSYGKKKEFD